MSNETSPKGSECATENQIPYSDDESPPTTNEGDELMWRRDPVESFSDWTIEIITNQQIEEGSKEEDTEETLKSNGDSPEKTASVLVGSSTTYHVHKCVLARGARKNEYFTSLFKATNAGLYNESSSNSSRIELDPLAASAFPAFLDYVYAPARLLETSTNSATALHALGGYFGNRRLRWDARQFCLKDMSLDNIDTYYEHAMICNDESVLSLVVEFTGKNVINVAPSDPVVKKTGPAFWLKVLSEVRQEPPSKQIENDSRLSRHWSKLVSEVGMLNTETLDKATFTELTNASDMSQIHEEAALALCEVDDGLHANEDDEEEGVNDNSSLRPLQKRCGDAMAKTWKKFNIDEDSSKRAMLERRTPAFLAALLVESLKEAKSALETQDIELEKTRYDLRKMSLELKTLASQKSKSKSTRKSRR